MRLFWGSIVSLAVVRLVIGCNTVSPEDCWPNTSGGFGGAQMLPIAAVGASSGDFPAAPPDGPLDSSEVPNPCVEGGNVSYFKPSNFPFVTIIADDGTDKGGGWQEAKAGLIFGPTPSGATVCAVRVGMPLRSYAWGSAPPSIAAIYTAKVANAAADELKKNGSFDLPAGIFCSRFKPEMQKQFDAQYNGLGAKMMVP